MLSKSRKKGAISGDEGKCGKKVLMAAREGRAAAAATVDLHTRGVMR